MGSNQETLGIGERLAAGSLAGAIAQSSIYPMEVSVQVGQHAALVLQTPEDRGLGFSLGPGWQVKRSAAQRPRPPPFMVLIPHWWAETPAADQFTVPVIRPCSPAV